MLLRGERVWLHVRSYVPGRHTTIPDHMPKAHRAHLEWSPSRLIGWGASIGHHTEALVQALLESRPHPEQGYRSCLGILRLAKQHGPTRLDAACDRALMRQLATGRWIAEHRNVLITGATGVGKTYLACALGQHACRQGYRAIYRRLPRFFQELALARADGSYTTVLARLARVDVLILDDWGLAAVTDVQRQDLLEVMEDRDATRSTIITSQLPRDQWHAYLGDPTIADAVLDRLVHNAYPITLKGPSRRKEKA